MKFWIGWKNGKNIKKTHACAREGEHFSSHNQKCTKKKLLKFMRIKFEKKSLSGIRKSEKNNIWNLDLGRKMKNCFFFSSKKHASALGSDFF